MSEGVSTLAVFGFRASNRGLRGVEHPGEKSGEMCALPLGICV